MATEPTRRSERAEPRIDAGLDRDPDATLPPDDRRDLVRAPSARNSPMVLLVLLMVLAAGAVFFYLWRQNESQKTAIVTPPANQPPAAAEGPPPIRHPIEDAQGAAQQTPDTKPLPALMVSDTTMQNTLVELFGAASLGKVFYEDAIIHRFVTTIDNLPRKALPARYLPVKPVPGPLATSAIDAKVSIADDNASRYLPYVQIAESIDAKNLVQAYVHFYPLLQQDYRDLGYPKAYFNDRLIETIDDLLAAPELKDPLLLVQPKVLYQYADPEVEARSAGQKIMIRMGSENAAKVKTKLREVRSELTGPKGAAPAAAKAPQ